jgi:hypothetical protein
VHVVGKPAALRRGGSVPKVRRLLVLVIAGVVGLVFAATGVSAGARVLTARCADRSGVVWKLRSVWGAPYTSHGLPRVRTGGTELTTSAPITRVHYAIKVFDGRGRLIQNLDGRRSFDFDRGGVSWLRRSTVNPPLEPGRVRIAVTVGRVGVAGCRVTFRQPALAAAPPRSHPAPAVPAPVVPVAPAPTPPAVVPPPVTPPVAVPADVEIAAVGDIHPAHVSPRAAATAAAAADADLILGLGDYQYESGTLADYNAYFDMDWGSLVPKMYPVLGPEHDQNWSGDPVTYWNGGGAHGYKAPVTLAPNTSYSFDRGAWHFMAIDDSCFVSAALCSPTALLAWVQADLAAHPSTCTLAYWHQAYFTSDAGHAPFTAMQPVVQALYDAGVDVVLQGHNHDYERFAPQTPQRVSDPANGIRAFVVGTGGIGLYSFTDTAANSKARSDSSYGVLRMTLGVGTYDWQFVTTAGNPFTDTGTGTCH